jgi:hypothetical protein
MLSGIANEINVRSTVALNRNFHDTEDGSAYMLAEEQSSNLTATRHLQFPLQLLNH